MALNASELSNILEQSISKYYANLNIDEIGTVLTIGDGIARVYGLGSIQAGEMCEFSASGIKGMALNLETENVSVERLFANILKSHPKGFTKGDSSSHLRG